MKALVAAGGYGTRLFPATRAVPKPMLPVAGKPLIQHVVEELAACGVEEIGIICRRSQTTIVDHFRELARSEFIFCDGSRCLGEAMRLAKPFVGDAPFILALGDEIGMKEFSPIPMLLAAHEQYRCTVGASRGAQGAPYRVTSKMWEELNQAVAADRRRQHTLEDCIDVPAGVMIGRYICDGDFFSALEALQRSDFVPDFLDAFGYLASCGRLVAMPFAAAWWHCGDATQLLRAVLDHAVTDPEMGRQVRAYLDRRNHGEVK
jgi:UTP--glucose-1-phosphate uridylyltransferase